MYGASVLALNGVIKAAEVRVGRSGKSWGQEATRRGCPGGHSHLQPLLGTSLGMDARYSIPVGGTPDLDLNRNQRKGAGQSLGVWGLPLPMNLQASTQRPF